MQTTASVTSTVTGLLPPFSLSIPCISASCISTKRVPVLSRYGIELWKEELKVPAAAVLEAAGLVLPWEAVHHLTPLLATSTAPCSVVWEQSQTARGAAFLNRSSMMW